jgi:hypothetical protein
MHVTSVDLLEPSIMPQATSLRATIIFCALLGEGQRRRLFDHSLTTQHSRDPNRKYGLNTECTMLRQEEDR